MTESMIERIATVIALESEGWTKNAKDYIPHARAVIETMREPTDAMVMAAEWAEPEYREDDMDVGVTFKAEWRAAIDAALNEQVSG